jgi:hypothetical protein
MIYTPIEIIAMVIIAGSVIKMLMLLVNAKSWMNFVKGFYKNVALAQILGLIVAAVVLYYLRDAGITIVQILAVMGFLAGMLLVGLAPYVGDIVKKYERQVRGGSIIKDNWLYVLLWLAILVWGAKELFM